VVTVDFFYPDWGRLVDFLLSGVKKLLAWMGIEPTFLVFSQLPVIFDMHKIMKLLTFWIIEHEKFAMLWFSKFFIQI